MRVITRKKQEQKCPKSYDVCIIGAGPGALACLSAIQEPYSLDHLTDNEVTRANSHLKRCNFQERTVAVIDPNPDWMQGWEHQFQALSIKTLRSPALAHPDMFDQNSLLAFAQKCGRQNELIESGCFDIKKLLPLGQSQVGLWKLPTLKLFVDFCRDLVLHLKHEYICDTAVDVEKINRLNNSDGMIYEICLASGATVCAKNLILAMGTVGKPNVPAGLLKVPQERLVPWKSLDNSIDKTWKKVLVVGGGLTAVQSAQRVIAQNPSTQVTICSRRPLAERHFDLHVEWFDRRTRNKCMSSFYHQSPEDRLQILRQSRNGGSVPAMYMKAVCSLEQTGRLHRVVGHAEYVLRNESALCIKINDSVEQYDVIILACGIQPDCQSIPLCSNILRKLPIPVVGGFPCINEDAQWTANLFVVGSLASMNIGPDAANLMGMRRAAEIIANTLECRCWLRHDESNVLKNPFDALFMDSDTEEDVNSDSELSD